MACRTSEDKRYIRSQRFQIPAYTGCTMIYPANTTTTMEYKNTVGKHGYYSPTRPTLWSIITEGPIISPIDDGSLRTLADQATWIHSWPLMAYMSNV